MIYELTYGGYRLGTFPTEAEAVRRAGYLPKGRYTVREWERDGEFSTFDPRRINTMTSTTDTMKKQVYVSKRSDLSLIGSAFEAAGFRCVRIRTECEVEHRTKGGDSRRHGMLVLDGDRVILEITRSKNTFEGRRYRRASPPISRKDC